MTVAMIATQVLGDLINIFRGDLLRGGAGFLIAGALLFYLLRPKLPIQDLSTGHVIRQHREKDYYGNYLRRPTKPPGPASPTVTSAFDDDTPYELTELGVQFSRYTMEGVMPSIAQGPRPSAPPR